MNEFEFIEAIKQQTYKQDSVIKGIGDDAAVIRSSVLNIVTAVDTFVENIHFTLENLSGLHIGFRALAANISDLAAMGAIPKFYLVSIVVPSYLNDKILLDVFEGMHKLACKYDMDLIGGDTVSGNELVVTITVIGHISPNVTRYRSNARINDIVFVTGTLGDSAAGLYILQNDYDVMDSEYFINRHQMPIPRVHFAQKLAHIQRIALNDVSDGIGNELHEIASASNVDILIEDELIPVHESLGQFSNEQQFDWKYYGGEDFELVGTIGADDWFTLVELAKRMNTKITKIGKIIDKKGNNPSVMLRKDGQIMKLKQDGYTHMSRSTVDED